jgi:hypothetical protein
VRLEDPSTYLKVVASILPKDISLDVNHGSEAMAQWLEWLRGPGIVDPVASRTAIALPAPNDAVEAPEPVELKRNEGE